MAQSSKSFRHLGSGWKPGTRLWKYLKNQLAQDSQFFCGNLCDVRVTEAKMRFHHCLARIKSAIQMNNIHTARGCNTTWSCRSGDETDQDFGRETSRSLRNVLETTQTNPIRKPREGDCIVSEYLPPDRILRNSRSRIHRKRSDLQRDRCSVQLHCLLSRRS